jgi:RNA-directed DNA polymerase
LWPGIRQLLLSGSYEPSPVLRSEIPKRSGGKRPLGIPIVLDQVFQQAIALVIGPIFDPLFSVHSFGFRPG